MSQLPASEMHARISRFQSGLAAQGIDGAIILQRADLFYFSGTGQNAHLFIPASGEPALLVKKSLERAIQDSPLSTIEPLKSVKLLPDAVFSIVNHPKRIGMELDVVPANHYLMYQKMFKDCELIDVSPLIRKNRMVKSDYELEKLRNTACMSDRMFGQVSRYLEPGISEVALAGRLEAFYRSQGHQGAVRMRGFNQELFYGHLMSGANLAVPSFFDGVTGGSGVHASYPQGAGYKQIGPNEPIMIDYVGVLDGYLIDQARIFAIKNLPERLIHAHEIALQIDASIRKICRPGSVCADLYETADRIAAKSGLGEYFMGYGRKISFVGHGVGLELDEWPVIAKNSQTSLEPGMVFALEPKFVFPDQGAVGIENTYCVTVDGLEALTAYPNEIQFIV